MLYFRIYAFGVWLGLRNLLRNGFRLGLSKTLGKILQPVNSFSRFPEYARFIDVLTQRIAEGGTLRLLDIGSPKLLGLYLAYHHPVEILLTDVSSKHLDEYVVLWDCLARKARGTVSFQPVDARHLPMADASFQAVYALSVIEHIDTGDGDRQALREMFRVLVDGGLLAVSVPYGTTPVMQYRYGFAYNEADVDARSKYFFQKIYDSGTLRELLETVPGRAEVRLVRRRRVALLRAFLALGTHLRAILGLLNPLVALACCASGPYAKDESALLERYGGVVSRGSFYSDVVFSVRK